MCVLCDGSMVIVTSISGIKGLRFAACPLCTMPEFPDNHPDYHPGQSLTIGWGQGGAADGLRRAAK